MLNSCLLRLISSTENGQRTFSERIPSISSLPYTERQLLLDLEVLQLRRLSFVLIYYKNVMNHLTFFDPSDVLVVYLPDARSKSSHAYLQKPAKATNRLSSLFFFKSVDA
jgi:hypothetical protein